MNTPEDSDAPSPRATVAGLLKKLIERAEREIEVGKLTVARPGDLLDAARMLLELDDSAGMESSDEVGREIFGRLSTELGFGEDET
jgi:hypothetical protein